MYRVPTSLRWSRCLHRGPPQKADPTTARDPHQGQSWARAMKLKEYQERTLGEVKRFLEQLVIWRGRAREGDEWLFDFAEKAWEKAGVGRVYLKKDGLQRPLP